MSLLENDDSIDELDDSDDSDDDIVDPDDTNHLTSLFNSLLSTGKSDSATVPHVGNHSSRIIRSAFGVSSPSYYSTIPSSSIFGDSIGSYVEASSLFQPRGQQSPYFLSIDPTLNESNSINPLASNKLFVANIAYTATSSELKDFFINLGYNAIHVDLPNSRQKVNSHSSDKLIYYLC
jgi:hypothetical protein